MKPYNGHNHGEAEYNSWTTVASGYVPVGATRPDGGEHYAKMVHVANAVDLSAGDIEIGAVELKDATTEDRVNVRTNINTGNNELLVNLEGHVCPENTFTDVTVAPAGVLVGSDWQDMRDYGVLSVSVHTDQDSAIDGLKIEWSHDKSDITESDIFTVYANKGKTYTFGPAERYYRVSYTNGSTEAFLHITSIIRKSYVKPSSHRIGDIIVAEDDAELMKSVITGERPDEVYGNVQVSSKNNLKVSLDEYGDTPAIDAFDRLRVSDPHTLFDSKQLHDKQPLFWDEELGGSATSTHITSGACTRMLVTANASDYVVRQTKQRPNYQPGKSQLVFLTAYSAFQDLGTRKRVGLFDNVVGNDLQPNNGIFAESDYDGTIYWNVAKNGVITERVAQADWNVDKLDGTGVSGKTLNLNATQILIIDFEWLGVGRVRVGLVIDGIITYTHYFNHANDLAFDGVYMSTPNLPLRYSIESDGTGAGQLDHICGSIISEGGLEELGVLRSVTTNSTPVTMPTNTATYAVLGIRLKDIYKDITVTPTGISLLSVDKSNIFWSLRLNPTVGGTGWTYSPVADSALETVVGAGVSDNIVTGGVTIASGYISASESALSELKTALKLGSSIAGVNDEIVLCAHAFNSPNIDVCASITVRELL
jgi:hypothetical protein